MHAKYNAEGMSRRTISVSQKPEREQAAMAGGLEDGEAQTIQIRNTIIVLALAPIPLPLASAREA